MPQFSDDNFYDIAIIGAGPIGLAFAISLKNSGLRVALIEKQSQSTLASPEFDGRDIALTHESISTLKSLRAWDPIPTSEISALNKARVINGNSSYFMSFNSPHANLGFIVSNHLIRKALFDSAQTCQNLNWFTEQQVTALSRSVNFSTLNLSNQVTIKTRLVVAADSRFSESRRSVGIAANMLDFAKVMLTCRMQLEFPHQYIATEWFGYDQTIATLPLNNNCASVITTLPALMINDIQHLSNTAFTNEISNRLRYRYGKMQLIGQRHMWPLVATYAHKFAAERFAVIGDAAVGMHPVTAHGFNFGLRSVEILSQKIISALNSQCDFSSLSILKSYEKLHRRTTLPLYLATNAIVKLYTQTTPPAKLIRHLGLHVGSRLLRFKDLLDKRPHFNPINPTQV